MIKEGLGLYTDLYQLTMGQAYLKDGLSETPACFDYFFRKIPFGGGYVVFAGLGDLLELLAELRFGPEDLDYLRSLGFGAEFIDYLKDFRFEGSILSALEGEMVFPLEPFVRVEGRLIEAQLVETLLLNVLNFESLIATKASRMRLAAGDRILSDFGLRRAHGFGGVQASRAAAIGGFDSTSNVYAAHRFGLKPAGTMAHSYVESHGDELAAFRRFAEDQPQNCVLLVDTYDTLKSGIPHAIIIGKEMERKGQRLLGVRLDSGDLAFLSKKARQMLDEAGLSYVKIAASNLLDEYIIRSLLNQEAPIDIFGVGTKLITGAPDAALDGIYKLSLVGGEPRLKLSETVFKTTLPGRKKILRFVDGDGMFQADAIALDEESDVSKILHPFDPDKSLDISEFAGEPLLEAVMENGRILVTRRVEETADYARERLSRLPPEHRRFENPHIYKVGLSTELADLRARLIQIHRKEH